MKRWSSVPLAMALTLGVGSTPAFAQGAPQAGQGRGGGGGGAPRVEVVRPANQRVPPAYDYANMFRPIAMADNVFMSELTIIEMRDLVNTYGYTTAIITNGTVEANGPYLTTGKHNHVLRVTADAIARTLGKTLVAPPVMLDTCNTQEGQPLCTTTISTPGSIKLQASTLHAVLKDMANSLKAQGFKEIFFIGDSGSNQNSLQAVATELSNEWRGQGVLVAHIREYYNYSDVLRHQNEVLIPTLTAAKRIEENKDLDGYHDDYYISSLIMNDDPSHVRYFQRVPVSLDHINSVPLVLEEALEIGQRLAQFRADVTVAAIKKYREVGYPAPTATTSTP